MHTSLMHEACTQWHACRLPAAFHQKMRGTALHRLLPCPDKGAGGGGVYSLLPPLWDFISQGGCISSHLPLMLSKCSYHLALFVARASFLHALCAFALFICPPPKKTKRDEAITRRGRGHRQLCLLPLEQNALGPF